MGFKIVYKNGDKQLEFHSSEDLLSILNNLEFNIIELIEERDSLIENFDILVEDMANMSKRNVELWETIGKLQKELKDEK